MNTSKSKLGPTLAVRGLLSRPAARQLAQIQLERPSRSLTLQADTQRLGVAGSSRNPNPNAGALPRFPQMGPAELLEPEHISVHAGWDQAPTSHTTGEEQGAMLSCSRTCTPVSLKHHLTAYRAWMTIATSY